MTDKVVMKGVSAPRVDDDTAVILAAYHLAMTIAYFEAGPEHGGVDLILSRLEASKQDDLGIRSARAFLETLEAEYDALDDEDEDAR